MTTWFTAGTFFGHEAIITSNRRPFADVAAMDEALIARWNERVKAGDRVWHLGNFVGKRSMVADVYLRRLNGEKHLICDNSDREATRTAAEWASCRSCRELLEDGILMCLFHYPMLDWRRRAKGALHFSGHGNGRLPPDAQSCNVNVDNPTWNYGPVALEEILDHLRAAAPGDGAGSGEPRRPNWVDGGFHRATAGELILEWSE